MTLYSNCSPLPSSSLRALRRTVPVRRFAVSLFLYGIQLRSDHAVVEPALQGQAHG
jgi:hypothetical protein